MRILSLITCILLFLILGCSNSNSDTDIKNRPVEEQLVFLDTNKLPKPDDVKVKQISELLNYLTKNTTSSRREIGDITTGTVDIIKNKYSKTYTHQQILEGGKRIIDTIPSDKRSKKESFKDVAALLVIESSTK